MNIETVEVGARKYNVVKATAVKQKTLLSLVGAKIAFNSANAQAETIDQNFLFGALLSTPEAQFDEIANIVLHQTVEKDKTALVTVDDFANRMTDYYLLVAGAVVANLQDFFTYLDSVNAETRQAAKKSTVQ